MTASKYGFLPGSANGIVVTDGGDVQQDFTLSPAPAVTVNGVVRDGSGGNWPLYAKVVIKASGAPTFTMYTDPVTGYYSQNLRVRGAPTRSRSPRSARATCRAAALLLSAPRGSRLRRRC